MKTIQIATFEEFEQQVLELMEDSTRDRGELKGRMLFRGQAKARWKLETTLERCSRASYSLADYLRIMQVIRPTVQSCVGRSFDDFPESYVPEHDARPNAPQGYSFMAYLRHHGFPSPLLDWTQSFYVAAFFAFQRAEIDDDTNVAIYSFIEYGKNGKAGWSDQATIVGVGPCVTTDRRHFLQQCQYTFCKKQVGGKEGQYIYASHEDAFARGDEAQDILTKFVLPRTERPKVLDRLFQMNVHAYSLFGSEDALLADLAYARIERRQ